MLDFLFSFLAVFLISATLYSFYYLLMGNKKITLVNFFGEFLYVVQTSYEWTFRVVLAAAKAAVNAFTNKTPKNPPGANT